MDKFIWAGSEAPDWMQGGSYVVARRARIALEHWDKMKIAFQEQTVGRQKASGAPIGKQKEFDKADLDAVDADGNPVIAENSHLRLATAATNDGAQILRRSYSYNDGVNFTAERWPPWRQGMEYDAGLVLHVLSARPAHRLHQDFRQDVEVRHDEPVRHPYRRRPVRLSRRGA